MRLAWAKPKGQGSEAGIQEMFAGMKGWRLSAFKGSKTGSGSFKRALSCR